MCWSATRSGRCTASSATNGSADRDASGPARATSPPLPRRATIRYRAPMIIALAPVPMTPARGLAALAAAAVVGSGLGLAAYRRNRRIMRRGARLNADILDAALEPVGPRFAG